MRFIPALENVVPYEPGQPLELVMRRFGLSEVVKLASNEFPLPPFEEVKTAIVDAIDDLNRYPDGHATDLRADLAAHFGRDPGEVTVGNGSCELLCFSATRCSRRATRSCSPIRRSWSTMISACATRPTPVMVPLADFRHDLEAMAAAVTPRTKMVVVCNPNNPTGTYVPVSDIERLVEAVPGDVLIVVDEAYNEFVTAADSQGSLALQAEHDNVIVLRTFSKIYGLCGLRVGYGVCAMS